MKQPTVLILIMLFLSALSFTGFQCGSAESTSAKLYIQRGDLEAAEASLKKEVDKNPANAEAWWLLGHTRVDRKSTRLNSSHIQKSRMPSSA